MQKNLFSKNGFTRRSKRDVLPGRVFKRGLLAAASCAWLLGHTTMGGVFISEFMADNSASLRTAAGQYSDWIELANHSASVADVGGWHLTDNATNLTRWRIPVGTTIPPNGYLIIFADSSETSITNNELHANFSLSKDGEYLGLVRPDGVTVEDDFSPEFPPQFENISYGHSVLERDLLSGDGPVRYRVPNAAGTAPWQSGVGALGFSGTNGAFTVSYYEVEGDIPTIDVAEFMVANPATWKTDRAYPIVGQYEILNFNGTGSPGNFGGDLPFPGHSAVGEDRERFIVVAKGSIYVPAAGQYTFSVGSDDGFRLKISGHGIEFVSEYITGRGFDVTLGTFNFPQAGAYDLSLIFNENQGGSGLELTVAAGFQEVFSTEAFKLLGDSEAIVRHAGSISSAVETDVSPVMQGVNSRLDTEWEFDAGAAPGAEDTLALSILCADGFSASLNGTPLAALNVPAPLAWNSAATKTRPLEQVLQWLTFSARASALVAGTNKLSVVALNNNAADPDFLIHPRLVLRTSQNSSFYYKYPTPRWANSRGYTSPTPKVFVSEPRGYRTEPFNVSLSSTNPAAEIRYTLDGSVPRTNSTLYTGPIPVSKTTTLRAAVVDPATIRQAVATTTWLFLEDVLRQGSTPPPGWPSNRQVNNHTMEYGMRQAILTSDGARLRQAMTNSIPSISIVTELANLFSAQTGIYVNPGNDGRAWERPVSIEMIDPVRGKSSEFRIDGGLRIRGAFSRSSSNPKHSFRLFFRSDYGEGKLRFPLFDDEGASEFDKVDLRTAQNYSWAYGDSSRTTFIRETFSRDAQREMGMPYTRSRYYHLFLNGQYWGLYQTQERSDADYAETYLGGDDDDWDCIKTTQPGYTTTASDGNFIGFFTLHNLAVNQGFSGAYANNYFRVKGLNPDGSTNASYPVYLDEDNLINYMLTAYYTGDPDSPVSIWGGMPNNMYALFDRRKPDGFKWFRHDAEHSMGSHGGYPVTCDTTGAGAGMTAQSQFNPAILHHRLTAHPQYRLRFADLVQKHFYGDGVLAPENAQNLFRSRMNELDLAIIGESARWGRGRTRDADWLPECNRVLNTYLNIRRDIVVGQFRARGWFPSINAPSYSVINTQVVSGQSLRLAAAGNFYYTLDGSDPRRPDGSINPSAILVQGTVNPGGIKSLVKTGAVWRYYDGGAEPAPAGKVTWRDRTYSDAAWAQGPAILGFAGSSPVNQVSTPTRRYVTGNSGPQVNTTYFRHTFNLTNASGFAGLAMQLLRDDGVIVYLNGVEILRDNMNSGRVTYDTYSAEVAGGNTQTTYYNFTVEDASLLRVGANTLAVELHQCNSGSSDLYFDFSLTALPDLLQTWTDLVVTNDLALKARAFSGAEWSALSENFITVALPPMDYSKLRVSELMYAPAPPPEGSPYDADDFAWVELCNTGVDPLRLDNARFGDGIDHVFGTTTLPGGGRLVLAKKLEAFSTLYDTNGINVAEWDSGNLARKGETLALLEPSGTNILTFAYTNVWYPETFTTGMSLVAVNLAAEEPAWSTAANWRPSSSLGGTPGRAEPCRLDNPRITEAGELVMEAWGLEAAFELWFTPDLKTWSLCPPASWSLNGSTITVNLKHPALPASGKTFFRLLAAP